MKDDIAIHRKFGFDQAIEMEEIIEGLRKEGMTGVSLHFSAVRTYEERHKNDPSYSERQKTMKCFVPVTEDSVDKATALIEALVKIRDGYNDPRKLCRDVLESIGYPS